MPTFFLYIMVNLMCSGLYQWNFHFSFYFFMTFHTCSTVCVFTGCYFWCAMPIQGSWALLFWMMKQRWLSWMLQCWQYSCKIKCKECLIVNVKEIFLSSFYLFSFCCWRAGAHIVPWVRVSMCLLLNMQWVSLAVTALSWMFRQG